MQINQKTRTVSLNVRESDFYNDPYPYYEKLRKETPVFFWEDYKKWTFVNHKDVNAILRDRRFGRQISHVVPADSELIVKPRPELKPFYDAELFSLLLLEPPDHSRLRGLVQKAFMSRQVEKLQPRIIQLAQQLCDKMAQTIADEGVCDLKAVFATPIPVIVIAEMLGIPTDMADHLLHWSHCMVKMYEPDCTAENEQAAVIAAQEFFDYLKDFVAIRRKDLKDDLISHLISVEEEGEKLTEHELICNCILLLNAGHEATVNVVGNGVNALLQNREKWDQWRHSPELSKTAVEELMRFDTPLHIFDRWVLEDLEYEGRFFKKGTEVSLVLGAANRDPAVFESADKMILDRPKNPHVSLGGGIHFCIGAPLARLELQTSLPILMSRFPSLQLAESPVYANSYHFHGLESLLVKL
ncbi:MAG: cytochrome P450 [Cellvibrionaceae bacterium]|jgi:cytochrome P450